MTNLSKEGRRDRSIGFLRTALKNDMAEIVETGHRDRIFEINGAIWADVAKHYHAGTVTIEVVNDHGSAAFYPYCGGFEQVRIELFGEEIEALREAAIELEKLEILEPAF